MKNLSRSAFGILIFTMVFGMPVYAGYTQDECKKRPECPDPKIPGLDWGKQIAGSRDVCRVEKDGKCELKFLTFCLEPNSSKYKWIGDSSTPNIVCRFYHKINGRTAYITHKVPINVSLSLKDLTNKTVNEGDEICKKEMATINNSRPNDDKLRYSNENFIVVSNRCATDPTAFQSMSTDFERAFLEFTRGDKKVIYNWPDPSLSETKTSYMSNEEDREEQQISTPAPETSIEATTWLKEPSNEY